MITLSQETIEALEKQTMQGQINDLQRRLGVQEQYLKAITDERDKALRWGIGTLGAAVLALVSYIINFITSHLK